MTRFHWHGRRGDGGGGGVSVESSASRLLLCMGDRVVC